MTALSLFILCIIVSHHVLSNESILLWYISVIVEALLFVYSYFHYYCIILRYLCMFDVFKPTLTGFIGTLSPIELGLFESTDIGFILSHSLIYSVCCVSWWCLFLSSTLLHSYYDRGFTYFIYSCSFGWIWIIL